MEVVDWSLEGGSGIDLTGKTGLQSNSGLSVCLHSFTHISFREANTHTHKHTHTQTTTVRSQYTHTQTILILFSGHQQAKSHTHLITIPSEVIASSAINRSQVSTTRNCSLSISAPHHFPTLLSPHPSTTTTTTTAQL